MIFLSDFGNLEDVLDVLQILLLSLRNLRGNGGKELLSLVLRSLALRNVLLDFLLLLSRLDSLEWVEFVHEGFVLEWVPSLSWVENLLLFLVSEDTLDLIRVDDGVDVWVRNDLSLESVVSLLSGSILGSELFGKLSHGTLGVNGESSELTTWGKSLKVKSLDVDNINAWDVSKGSSELLTFVIDNNERSLLDSVLLSSDFGNSSSDDFTLNDSLDVVITSESLE
jgi:hypothetical protein